MSRSHYQRKAQVAYEASVQTARANLRSQKEAPGLYQMFASGSPSFGPQRGGGGSGPRNLHLWGPIGSNRACNGCSYSPGSANTSYFSFAGGQYNKNQATYKSLADGLRQGAISAEIGGITAAQKRLDSLLSAGVRQVGSQRGKSKEGDGIKIDSVTGQYIPKGQEKKNTDGSYSFSNSSAAITSGFNFANTSYEKMGQLAKNIAAKDPVTGEAKTKAQKDKLKKEYQTLQRGQYLANFHIGINASYGSSTAKLTTKTQYDPTEQLNIAVTGGSIDLELFDGLSKSDQNSYVGALREQLYNKESEKAIKTNKNDLSNVNAEIKSLQYKIDYQKGVLEKKQEQVVIPKTEKQKKADFASNLFGSTTGVMSDNKGYMAYAEIYGGDNNNAYSEHFTTTAADHYNRTLTKEEKAAGVESKKLAELKNKMMVLNSKKDKIQSTRTSYDNVINMTGGQNAFYKSLYDKKQISGSTAGLLMTTSSTQDYGINNNLLRTITNQQNTAETKQEDYSNVLGKLKNLKLNPSQIGYEQKFAKIMNQVNIVAPDVIVEGDTTSHGTEIVGNTTNVGYKEHHRGNDDRTTVDGVIKQMTKVVDNQTDKIDSFQETRSFISGNMSAGLTNEQRLGIATIVNKDLNAKQTVKELTGLKVGNANAVEFTKNYMSGQQVTVDRFGKETKTDIGLIHQADSFGNIKSDHGSFNIDRMNAWMQDGGSKYQYQDKAFDLIIGGKSDASKRDEVNRINDIINKYQGDWTKSSGVIDRALGSWKSDVTKYYKESYQRDDVSLDDADTIEVALSGGVTPADGESYVAAAEDKVLGIGVNIDYKDGDWKSQRRDLSKVLRLSVSERKKLHKAKMDNEKSLNEARKQQIILKQKHNELKPGVEERLSNLMIKGSDGISRPAKLDKKFGKQLISSSQKVFDISNRIKQGDIQQIYYEKSLKKTDADIEIMKKNKRTLDYKATSQITSGGHMNRSSIRSNLYGYNKARQFSNRNPTPKKTIVRGGNISLGGLVL